MTLEELIGRDEGLKLKAYPDTEGHLTVGYGHNLEKPISLRAAQVIRSDDIQDAKVELNRALPWTANLDEVRRAVFISMAYNMGINGLLGFRKALAAAKAGDYHEAAIQMLDSQWAKEVGNRALRLANQMTTGLWT